MATIHGWHPKPLSKLWAASFAAALTMSGASAWAQTYPATPQSFPTEPAAAAPTPCKRPVVVPAAAARCRHTGAACGSSPRGDSGTARGRAQGYAVPSFVTGHPIEGESNCRLSDVPIGIQPIPERPALLYEDGKFLSPGFLSKGIELPTGEIVRPSWWVFGTDQFAYQYFNNKWSTQKADEFVDRLDIYTQLNLSATERAVIGFRPLDREVDGPNSSKRKYTEVDFQDGRFINGTNISPSTYFFEGDFGEIFPGLDHYDSKMLDYGFSVGRQPLLIQDGLLINADMLDGCSITRNTLNGHGNLNFRATGFFAWDEVHRNDDVYDPTALLYGVFLESDYKETTVNADFVYVSASDHTTGSAAYAGLSAIQRIDVGDVPWNTSFHALISVPTYEQTAATGQGELLFAQVSMTPHGTPNLIYATAFWAIDNFSSAARNPEVGGPLGQVGILFASPAIGLYGSPLNNYANHVAGGVLGYQILLDDTRKQLIFEVAGRKDTNGIEQGQIGIAARYQQACGQHTIFLFDAFLDKQEGLDVGGGCRASVIVKF